jgi:hypothetical protein
MTNLLFSIPWEGERPSNKSRLRVAIAVGVCLVILPVLLALKPSERLVGLNHPIQYDDFAFSVLGVRKAQALGEGEAQRHAQGVYLIVTLKVENRARRVSFQFRDETAIVIDGHDQEHQVSCGGQAALESEPGHGDPCPGPIPAGVSCVKEIVFDVSPHADNWRLKFTGGGPVGEFLDNLLYGRMRIKLP